MTVYGSRTGADDEEWCRLADIPVSNVVYSTYSYRPSPQLGLRAFRLAVAGVPGVVDPHVDNKLSEGVSQPQRVLLDEVCVSELMQPNVRFVNVGAFGMRDSDYSDLIRVPNFPNEDVNPQPGELFGIQCELQIENEELLDAARQPQVILRWRAGETPWGYEAWQQDPMLHEVRLTQVEGARWCYRTAKDANMVMPADADGVVQYMLEVEYYDSTSSEPRRHLLRDGEWTPPAWYGAIDIPTILESESFSAYVLGDPQAYMTRVLNAFTGCRDGRWWTPGASGWEMSEDASQSGGLPIGGVLRSGAIGNGDRSLLEARFEGPGRLSFDWKVSCEAYKNLRVDYSSLWIDGEERAWIAGEVGWTNVVALVEGPGEHVVQWLYVKDEIGAEGEDCAWIKNVGWNPLISVGFVAQKDSSEYVHQISGYEGDVFPCPNQGDALYARHEFLGWTSSKHNRPAFREGDDLIFDRDDTLYWAVWQDKRLSSPIIVASDVYYTERCEVVLTFQSPEIEVQIYYTTDGRDPSVNGNLYEGPFEIEGTRTVRAIAVQDDGVSSDEVSKVIQRFPWTAAECVNNTNLAFSFDGDLPWQRDQEYSKDGVCSMRSGPIGNGGRSVLRTTVEGSGTLSFWWRVSSETYKSYQIDFLSVKVDGQEVEWIGGEVEWSMVSLRVEGEGPHVVEWVYSKDGADGEGADCGWVDLVDWMSDADLYVTVPHEITGEGDVTIGREWFAQYPSFSDLYGSDLSSAVLKPTGKRSFEGASLAVWHDYIAGTDPTDPKSVLRAAIELRGDKVFISWSPNLNEQEVSRIYTIYGRSRLDSGEWETPVKPTHRFFKVRVSMPKGAEGEETAVPNVGFDIDREDLLGGVQLWENGPYWAECNVGAEKPEDYGYYFWWGDTVGYVRNANDNGWVSVVDGAAFGFQLYSAACLTVSKSTDELIDFGCIDSDGNLNADYDAASCYLGARWRMPTVAEWNDLVNKCDTEWTTRNGVYGRVVTGRGAYASKSIFLPAAGHGGGWSELYNAGVYGNYWTSAPELNVIGARCLILGSNRFDLGGANRFDGLSVRPVRGFAQ